MQNKSRAFTLIELLVVVLIIGILAAVALPQYTFAVEKARAAEAFTLTRAIADANTVYYLANNAYGDYPDLGMDIPGEPTTHSETIHGIKTKYFSCRTRTPTGNVQFLGMCNRKIDDENSYTISISTEGEKVCSYEGQTAKKICKVLTGKSTTSDDGKYHF